MASLSIIIPVYNAKQTLSRCLDSVLMQDYKDYEVILIDDGSNDGSAAICDEYASKDSRVIVLHEDNHGVSFARNAGLNIAQTQFVTFIDSDDLVEPGYLASLIKGSDVDIAVTGFHSSEGIDYCPSSRYYDRDALSRNIPDMVNHPYMLYAPWGKLFKRDIIETYHLRFDEHLRLFEDTIFVLTYLSHCNTMKEIPSSLYYYIGVWGGVRKYTLSTQEVEYRCQMESDVLTGLENVFACSIPREHRCYCINYLKNIFESLTDEYCYQLYSRYHDGVSAVDFYDNPNLNPMHYELSRVKKLYGKGCVAEGWAALRDLAHFSTQKAKIPRKDEAIIYRLLLSGMVKLASMILRIYSLLQKTK